MAGLKDNVEETQRKIPVEFPWVEIIEEISKGFGPDDLPKNMKKHQECASNGCSMIAQNLNDDLRYFWEALNIQERLIALMKFPRSPEARQPYWCPEEMHYKINKIMFKTLMLKKHILLQRTKLLESESVSLAGSLLNTNQLLQEQLNKIKNIGTHL